MERKLLILIAEYESKIRSLDQKYKQEGIELTRKKNMLQDLLVSIQKSST